MDDPDWKPWSPSNENDEAAFCDLVCADCTRNSDNEAGYPIGCSVLNDAINHGGDQILFNEKKGSVKCLKQKIKGQPKKYRCKKTLDLF